MPMSDIILPALIIAQTVFIILVYLHVLRLNKVNIELIRVIRERLKEIEEEIRRLSKAIQ